jgi:hypothetical protein
MHVISIAPFVTSNAIDTPVWPKVAKAYVDTARQMLAQHAIGIELKETGLAPGTPYMLSWAKSVDNLKHGGELRQMCQDAYAVGNAIPVIFCMFFQAADYGATVLTGAPQNDGKPWGPYILINLRLQARFNAVLLHELIHAAYDSKAFEFKQPGHDPEANSIFHTHSQDKDEDRPQSQVWLPTKHVAALRKADFTTTAIKP